MNHTFPLERISETGNLDFNLILRQYKQDLMAGIRERKSINPKIRPDQIAKKLGYSSSTLKRYRHHVNMHSPFRIPPISHKRRQKIFF